MSKPAHKQDDPAKSPGQIVNDITLGDYITRKNYHEAFDKVAEEKGLKKNKLKFDDWWDEHKWDNPCFRLTREEGFVIWKAAQDNV